MSSQLLISCGESDICIWNWNSILDYAHGNIDNVEPIKIFSAPKKSSSSDGLIYTDETK